MCSSDLHAIHSKPPSWRAMVGTATLTMVWSSAPSRMVIITAAVAARSCGGVSTGEAGFKARRLGSEARACRKDDAPVPVGVGLGYVLPLPDTSAAMSTASVPLRCARPCATPSRSAAERFWLVFHLPVSARSVISMPTIAR